jgi:hypothetical protein
MQSEILVLPWQLAFEPISRHHFSVAPNIQWAWAMIRGICATRAGRFTPLVDVPQMPVLACDAIAVDRQLPAKTRCTMHETHRPEADAV